VISTRARFTAAFVATIVGIAALSLYGYIALESAAKDAGNVHDDLERLQATSDLEDDVRELGAAPDPADRALLAKLDRHEAVFVALPVEQDDREEIAGFDAAVAAARANPSSESWFRAGVATGAIEESIIRRSKNWGSVKRATRMARNVVLIGGGLVVLFALASAAVFLRWRREEREAHERLRRSDRLAALGTVAASVAHEINNPLATISGCATAVRDRVRRQEGPNADSLEYLDMIADETRRCSGIVKSLRDLARDGPPAVTAADLAKLARSVVALLEMDRKAKPVLFVVEGDDPVESMCDPDKLKQLLLNLLINAREASQPEGRVTVRVERSGAAAARICVADEGRGIERRDLARIFEPFHTDKTQGLGIGLFLCERIAAQHGGTIHAESGGRGMGARFVVEFPTRTGSIVPPAPVS
jgi:signal transduction histidine kinase